MKMRTWILFIFSLLAPLAAFAAFDPAGITMTASVNKTVLTMEDELTLTVKVDGAAGNFMPQLPSLPSFNVYARSSSKQINNFHAISTFEYVMLPRFAGKATIGPVTLRYGNKTYETEPITVTVYRTGQNTRPQATNNKKPATQLRTTQNVDKAPANMPALERDLYNRAARNGNQDFFMVAATNNTTPYVGQTVSLGVRFYYSRPFLDNAPYTAPVISNLFMEEISTSEGRQIIAGKEYAYMEKRYAVSGVTEGKAQAGAATVKYIPASRLDLSIFDRMFATTTQEGELAQSNTVSFDIRPLPTLNQPDSFYGAVGTGYTISAAVDREQVEAGEAVNLTVKVNGTGNLKSTSDLKLPALPGFRTYDVASNAGSVGANGQLKSYKIFKTVIVPQSSGKYEIPALKWSYFNPQNKQYLTLQTQPISIEVSPSTKTASDFNFGTHSDLGGVRQLGQDIRYLKSNLTDDKITFLSRVAKLHYVNYAALFLLILAGIFAFSDKRTLASKRALAKARASLKNAQNEEAVAEALSIYLQIRYKVHTASLPLRDLSAALKKHGCQPDLIERFETLWQRLDAARFAPVDIQGEGTQALARQAEQLMKDMDKGGRK